MSSYERHTPGSQVLPSPQVHPSPQVLPSLQVHPNPQVPPQTHTPVIKEQLFPWFNVAFGIYANPVISIDHHHFGKAVGVDGMVCKPYLVPLPSGVHHKIWEGGGEWGCPFRCVGHRVCGLPWLRLNRKLHMYLSYTLPRLSASS